MCTLLAFAKWVAGNDCLFEQLAAGFSNLTCWWLLLLRVGFYLLVTLLVVVIYRVALLSTRTIQSSCISFDIGNKQHLPSVYLFAAAHPLRRFANYPCLTIPRSALSTNCPHSKRQPSWWGGPVGIPVGSGGFRA